MLFDPTFRGDYSNDYISPEDLRRLSRHIGSIGLRAVRRHNKPITFLAFAEMVAHRAGIRVPPDLVIWCVEMRKILTCGNHRRLQYQFGSFPTDGYIFDRKRPDTWPVVRLF